MSAAVPTLADLRFAHDPTVRGYSIFYRGAATACPGCGRSNWHVGRVSAECAFCATALPIDQARRG